MAREKPALWVNKNVPYEHVLVPFDLLHDELKAEVLKILHQVEFSRVGAVLYGLGPVHPFIPPDTWEKMLQYVSYPVVARSVYDYVKIRFKGEKISSMKFRDSIIEPKATFQASASTFLPYAFPIHNTLNFKKAIARICERDEAPFAHPSAPEWLKEYHYGVIDNEGNLVLLKHPLTMRAGGKEKIKQTILWKQPFQRPRFELNKPQLPEKSKERRKAPLVPRLAPAGARFFVARVKLARGK